MRASIEEYKAVEAEGNSSYAKELFIDEAVLFGYLTANWSTAASNSFTKMWIPSEPVTTSRHVSM